MKMADEGDNLSDAELSKQLRFFNVNVGPVTATTRKILLKKLNRLKAEESNQSATAATAKKRKSVASSTPSRQKANLAANSKEVNEPQTKNSASSEPPVASSRRRSEFPRVSTNVNNEEQDDRDGSSLGDKARTIIRPIGRRTSLPRNEVQCARPLDTLSGGVMNGPESDIVRQVSPIYRKNSFEFDDEVIHSRKSLNKKDEKIEKGRKTIHDESSFGSKKGDIQTTATMTAHQRHRIKDQTDAGKEEELFKCFIQDNGQDDEELEMAFAPQTTFFKGWKRPAFAIFFIVLLVCLVGSYMSLWRNRTSEWAALPDLHEEPMSAGTDRDQVFQVLQCLHSELSKLAGEKECGYEGAKMHMNGVDIGAFASKCETSFKGQLVNYEKIAVQVVNLAMDEKYSEFFSVQDDRPKFLVSVTESTLSSINLASKVAVKSLGCRIRQAVILLSKYLIGIPIVFGLLLGVYHVTKRRWMMEDEDTRLMFIFVEKIIETLRRHHDACQHDKGLPSYLPIPQVRDMLIPPRDRNRKARAWKKAVDFLSSTDSRIRVETQRISGEDFEVWRWIGVMTTDKKVRGASNHLGPEDETGKFWQGPAFDKIEKVVRLPIITPTPCLKIRYLHGGPAEKEEGWYSQVRDALLEKCNDAGARILHIYVDVKSVEGCVYVKCDSLESAGKAFRSIYGNWFDGRLVIVKFVTVARYHQRFPDALVTSRALKVSGEFPSSLSWYNTDAGTQTSKNK